MLKVSLSEIGSNVQIKIKATGCGIPEELIPHIFEPFFTQKRKGKGVGLGLSVAFGIIEAHKGRIDVKSTLDIGSTFTVQIPKNLDFNNRSSS